MLDREQGKILERLMFSGADYSENLRFLVQNYSTAESDLKKHLDGVREVKTLDGQVVEVDLRDCAFQLGLNNRIQSGIPIQFYTAGGAGPFDEILERVILEPRITVDKSAFREALPIAKRMIEGQRIIFSNEPGVFSYDESRQVREKEISTPPSIHPPKPNAAELPGKGIYILMTGIDGIRESGVYDAVFEQGLQLYVPEFSMNSLPKEVMQKAFPLGPSQINNPNILAQFARAGWSSVWLSHLAEKAFITPQYQERDDPEIFFNIKGIKKLGLGVVIQDDFRTSLKTAIDLAQSIKDYNQRLVQKFGTLDGIEYAAEKVVAHLSV